MVAGCVGGDLWRENLFLGCGELFKSGLLGIGLERLDKQAEYIVFDMSVLAGTY